ncbi:MAG: N-acetylglutaminylglutamine synthetase [Polyangiaceae bacterium]
MKNDPRRRAPDPRVDRDAAPTLAAGKPARGNLVAPTTNASIECGWGRLIFGHTFEDNRALVETLRDERPGARDIALYVTDPHVLVSLWPQELFLDPSHTFRMYLEQLRPRPARLRGFRVRRVAARSDVEAIGRIYATRQLVPIDKDFVWDIRASRAHTFLVAEDKASGEIIGTVTGIDHAEAFADPENGSSLWALAVDPQTTHPGVGEALVSHLLEHYAARERSFLDLSVMHDNKQAIRLYEKLGFVRVPVFCVKRKNPINEPLFIAEPPEQSLNPYAAIIVREARRRGIAVEVLNAEAGYFALSFGGRTIVCRESLSELTSAIAMSRCDDKRVTRQVLQVAHLNVPAQKEALDLEGAKAFLALHRRIVVKPARGEQGQGVCVDIRSESELEQALEVAGTGGGPVILEDMVDGEDVRIVVIDFQVVAAAVRKPPEITGDGEHSVRALVEKQSRRRAAATGGESRIPLDAETERCVLSAGFDLDDALPAGKIIQVRKTANLHTGGTIVDVTAEIHPRLIQAAERAAEALDIPVVGLDFMVPDLHGPRYTIIEANERPGLANHEPQPTAERFVNLLFPQTATHP